VARRKDKTGRISVFKGREARLNRAIIQVLGAKEPQTTRQLRKKITQIKGLNHTSYSTVNKRVRSLERSGYLRKAAIEERTGGITNFYELTPKAYLTTFLDSINLDNLINQVNEAVVFAILGAMILTVEENSNRGR
jgi:predicted transcriptional regulator